MLTVLGYVVNHPISPALILVINIWNFNIFSNTTLLSLIFDIIISVFLKTGLT